MKRTLAGSWTWSAVLFATTVGACLPTAPPVDTGSDASTSDMGTSETGTGMDGSSCRSSELLCSGTCTAVATDRANCGMCGRACATGEICNAGTCQVSCPTGQMVCNGQCATVNTDNANCGMCGKACMTGEVCSNGSCTSSCASGLLSCGGNDAGVRYCADGMSDRLNCNACGRACASGEICMSGACQLSCAAGSMRCPVGDAGMTCTDVNTDRTNCGMCGRSCASGEICSNGMCQVSCPTGQNSCNGQCANFQTDRLNCGSCSNACGMGEICAMGRCAVSCPTGTSMCGGTSGGDAGADAGTAGYCADLRTDPGNCGTCNTRCGTGEACLNGQCGLFAAQGVRISPVGMNCNNSPASRGRPIVRDAGGKLYILFRCATQAMISSSADNGDTWRAASAVPINPAVQLAGSSSAADTIIATATTGTGLRVSISTDGGFVWTNAGSIGPTLPFDRVTSMTNSPQVLIAAASTGAGASHVVIGNSSNGAGAFTTLLNVPSPLGRSVSMELLRFPSANQVYLVVDEQSQGYFGPNNGTMFGSTPVMFGTNGQSDSDMTTVDRDGDILIAGLSASNTVARFNLTFSATVTQMTGLDSAISRAITSDSDGNVYVASEAGGSLIAVHRFRSGQTSADPPLFLGRNGSAPNVTVTGTNRIMVVWTETQGTTSAVRAATLRY